MKCYLLLVAFAWAAVSNAAAQESGKAPWEEFGKRIKNSQSVGVLGPDLFGDDVALADGALSFSVTDVSLAGNNALPVAFARKYTVFNRQYYVSDSPLADWELDVPRLSGIFAPDWTVSNPTPSVARCSGGALPTQPASDYQVRDFWHGNTLSIPGVGGGELLSGGVLAPATSESFVKTTNDHIRIACLPTVKNTTGEGFLAITPDGTRYWFDWMAQYQEPQLIMAGRKTLMGTPDVNPVPRRKNVLYATKVQDRFGNTVDYTYTNAWNGRAVLTAITASDGRQITIGYANGNVSTVQAGTQTWTYSYGTTPRGERTLTQVQQPDLSRWTIGFAQLTDAYFEYRVGSQTEPSRSCFASDPPLNDTQEPIGTITHPSGAVGTFRVGIRLHGRSNVPINCENVTTEIPGPPGFKNDPNDDMNMFAISYDSFTLLDKTLSGPGMTTQNWAYSYSPGISTFMTPGATAQYPVCSLYSDPVRWVECHQPICLSDACAGASQTTVVGSDGSWMRYSYGNSYLYNEGKLLTIEQGSSATNVLRTVTNSYDLSLTDKVYPATVGLSSRSPDEGFVTEYTRPLVASVTAQDGATFSATTDTFDVFARPLAMTKSSSLGASKVETVEYADNLSKWVLGQVTRTTTDGTEVARTTYDATTALPLQTYAYGKLRQTFTWTTTAGTQAGTLKTVKDGNNNVITVSNWSRGVPQTVQYPATADQPSGSSESAVVNGNGWVTSTTDENGYISGYSYDAMGRLVGIVYPTGDSTVWAPTTQTFAASTAAKYGLPIGHWQQTVKTGNGTTIRYHDALWRPVVEERYDNANPSGTRSIVVTRYDGKGRLAFQSYPLRSLGVYTDPALKGVSTAYDALDRVTTVNQDSELGLLATTTEYLSGFKTRVTSPRHQGTSIATVTSYMAWDEPATDYPVAITLPEGAYVDIVRDVFGKPKSIKRRNVGGTVSITRSYVYDGYQQLCKTIEPETGSTLTTYDAAGNVSWTAGGQDLPATGSCDTVPVVDRTVRVYDARNRVKALVFPDNRGNTTYTYTPDGLLTLVATSDAGVDVVTTTYAYNKRRLLTHEQLQVSAFNWPLSYGYDANGHLASHTYPDGSRIDYVPNALGQPTKAAAYATDVTYYPNGAMAGFTYGNGIVHTMQQNVRQLPDRSTDSAGVLDDSYDYDGNGNVAAISDGLSGYRGDRDMSYDDLDRLKSVTSPMFAGGTLYTYDVLDNLIRVKAPGRDHSYIYDPKWQLTNVINTSGGAAVIGLDYDAQGNLTSKNGQLFDFDHGNRLREATGEERYVYDGHGRRVQATHPSLGSIYSMYGQDGALRYQRDERKGKAIDYVLLNGSLVARVSDFIAQAVPALSAPAYVTAGSYAVTWTTVPDTTHYELEEQANGGAWTQVASGTATAKTISGKISGIYDYRVRACNGSACGGWSAAASVAVELPPDAIPALTAPATSTTGSYTLSWTAPGGAETYILQESVNGGAWTDVYSGAALSKAYTGKVAGDYGYRIKACNPAGCTGFSATKTVQVASVPATAPTLTVPATSTTGSYAVSWSSVANATSYQLEEQVNGGTWAQVYVGAVTSEAFAGVAAGSYGYRVRACNIAGCGPFSSGATLTRQPTAAPAMTTPATTLPGSYTVSWTAVAGATGYRLEERINSGSWTEVQYSTARSKAYAGKTGGTYSYRARGCNAAGCGPYAAIKATQVYPLSTVTAPATNTLDNYSVSWTAVTSATAYRLEEKVGSGGWAEVANAAATSKAFTGKANGTYQYRVRACNASGCGMYSAIATTVVTLTPVIPATPTGIWGTGANPFGTKTTYRLGWSASTDATHYEVSPAILGCGTGVTCQFTRNGAYYPISFQVRACNQNGCSAWSPVTYTELLE